MTGELTLRGRVLPIGGFKEKVLAAHREGIKTVYFPEGNRKDLEEIPTEILPSLTAAKGEMNGPLVLILEDADRVLVPRDNKQGSMNAISQVLNLGDGILGSVLDIRIGASTNANKVEMDPATRRPGRLCRYSAVDALSAKESSDALSRLTGKPFTVKAPTTIAQIYRWAREHGWKPSKRASVTNAGPTFRTEIL